MRLLTADYIFPVSEQPIKNAYLLINDQGEIIELLKEETFINYKSNFKDISIEQYEGILCPGFINAHCHLELSYLKNLVPEKKGLSTFVKDLQQIRNQFTAEQIQAAIEKADEEMLNNGIVAVGDICNGNSTFSLKSKSKIKYHNFIELFGFDNNQADEIFERALTLEQNLKATYGPNSAASITPHAPYSVSAKLMKKMGSQCYVDGSIISIHSQETKDENTLFKNKTGDIADMLQYFGLNLDSWNPTGFNSMPSVLVNLPKCNKILLVHNTFTNKHDIDWANDYSKMIWWCFCPNANLYIENKLPDFNLFKPYINRLTIGTDSLASNYGLSILDEIKIIQQNSSCFNLDELIQMATKNGADYFGFNQLGSFEKGKVPGVNLITDIDYSSRKLTEKSIIKKIV